MMTLRHFRKIFLAASIIGPASLCVNFSANASTIDANCVVNKMAIVASDDGATTTAQSFVFMPKMTRTVKTTTTGCVIIDFSGEVSSDAGSRTNLNVVSTGLSQAPGGVSAGFPTVGGDFELRSMRFVFPNVPPGKHQFRMQWQNEGGSGAKSFVGGRTFTVSYQ